MKQRKKQSKIGIYSIQINHENYKDRIYIGSTYNIRGFKARWGQHKRELSKNIHHNTYLQNLVNKVGIDTIMFSVVEEFDRNEITHEEVLLREEYWMLEFMKDYRLLNLSLNADDTRRILEVALQLKIPCLQYTLDGRFIKEFKSLAEAKIARANIGVNKESQGFQWRIKESNEYPLQIEKYSKTTSKKVKLYDLNGNYLQTFNSMLECAKFLKVNTGNTSKALYSKSKMVNNHLICFEHEEILNKNGYKRKHKFQKKIELTNVHTNEVITFDSLREMEQKGRFAINSVIKALENNRLYKKTYSIKLITEDEIN